LGHSPRAPGRGVVSAAPQELNASAEWDGMNRKMQALVVENSPDDARFVARQLGGDGFCVEYDRVHDADTLRAARRR